MIAIIVPDSRVKPVRRRLADKWRRVRIEKRATAKTARGGFNDDDGGEEFRTPDRSSGRSRTERIGRET